MNRGMNQPLAWVLSVAFASLLFAGGLYLISKAAKSPSYSIEADEGNGESNSDGGRVIKADESDGHSSVTGEESNKISQAIKKKETL